jgi:hypothetical protein
MGLVKIILLSILSLVIWSIITLNVAKPIYFRYGCVECKIDYLWISPCGDNCTCYNYGLVYEGKYAKYVCCKKDCILNKNIYCDILTVRYDGLITYITNDSITTSNILNVCMLFILVIIFNIYLVKEIRNYLKNE